MVKGSEPSPQTWCDLYIEPGAAPRLVLPPSTSARHGSEASAMPKDRWVWLNFWATWCGPCLREMPLIERWFRSLRNQGAALELWYVSIDEDPVELSRFLASSPGTAMGVSLRLLHAAALGQWLEPHGLPKDTAIPINVFLAPGGQLRCVRTGAIAESDFSIVQSVIQGR
jgi:thiol-disulfide isomerase/thioredoxin